MTREHTPKPGANWGTRIVSVERVVPDDPADTHDDNQQPGRRERRARQRAKKKGRR